MHGRRSVESSRRSIVPREARRVGDTFVVDQPNGQPPRFATQEEIFRAADTGTEFLKDTPHSSIREALKTRKLQRLP